MFSGDKGKHIIDVCLENNHGSIAYKKYIKRKGTLLKGSILTLVLMIIALCIFNETSFLLLGIAMIVLGITLLQTMNKA